MAELAAMLHVDHQFHIANCPWTHGAIETCNRQVLNLLRSLCSELGLARQQWPTLIPLVRYALKQCHFPRFRICTSDITHGFIAEFTAGFNLVPSPQILCPKSLFLRNN
uniref:Integrase catalytic domain-containing protein n=1 Tax=Spongospora subterranea TaxID=70186 RepID=A0A0H5RDH0_9EUKA|eukprot:CRZ12058.1 hypothetical protein [Spongospora subterranea]